ncbi:MAG: DUF948 domain-containing protein [Lactovum sp.]
METILLNVLYAVLILLVVLVAVFVINLIRTMGSVNKTVKVMTADIDVLLHQTDHLMAKANTLLEDVNGKVATIDPLFTAVADLSESVSAVNDSSRNFVSKFSKQSTKSAKQSAVIKVGRTATSLLSQKKKISDKK